jgi:hypothetical protein
MSVTLTDIPETGLMGTPSQNAKHKRSLNE